MLGHGSPLATRERALSGAIAVAAVVLATVHLRLLRFVCDDAYITFRYAEHVARGLGPVYNPGERVEGYTNFLWMIGSAAALALGGAPERVMPAISAGCALAAILAVGLAFPGSPDDVAARRGRLAAAFARLALAASAGFAAWATSGLETALFTLLVLLGTIAAARGAIVWSAAALALATLTRPEGWLVSACVAGWAAFRGRAIGITPRGLAVAALVWAAAVLPHLAWRIAYYGSPVPNTFAIKAPGLASLAAGLAYLADAVTTQHLWLLLVPAALAWWWRRDAAPPAAGRARAELVAAVSVPYLAYVATTGGDFMPLHRFVAPMLPLLAIAAGDAWATATLDARGRLRGAAAAVGMGALAAFGALNVAQSLAEQQPWVRGPIESVGLTRINAAEWRRIGERLRAVALPTDTLAITAAGIVPYVSKLHTIDLLGLPAPDLSLYRRRETQRAGHTHYLSGAALERLRPQFLFGHPEVRPTVAHLGLTLDLEPEWRDRVLAHYALLGLTLPADSARGDTVRYVAVAVRHDAAPRVEAAGLRR